MKRLHILLASLAFLAGSTLVQAGSVSLISRTDTSDISEGTVNNIIPFWGNTILTQRYSQSIFTSLPNSGTSLTGISFRPDYQSSDVSWSFDSLVIQAFTSSNDSLVTLFSGSASITGAKTGIPSDFTVSMPLTNSFAYSPLDGDLFLRISVGNVLTRNGFLDADRDSGVTDRTYTMIGSYSGGDGTGLVTKLDFDTGANAVPDATSSFALLGAGFVLCLMLRRRVN